jgi:hypothetical protein
MMLRIRHTSIISSASPKRKSYFSVTPKLFLQIGSWLGSDKGSRWRYTQRAGAIGQSPLHLPKRGYSCSVFNDLGSSSPTGEACRGAQRHRQWPSPGQYKRSADLTMDLL